MTAGLRFGIAAAAAVLALAQAPALAQNTTEPAAEAPPENIGPRELQNFSLNGTVTRPAPATPAPAPPAATPPRERPAPTGTPPQAASPSSATQPSGRPAESAPQRSSPAPAPSVTVSLPPADAISDAPAASVSPSPAPAAEPTFDATDLGPQATGAGGITDMVPWLLALILFGAGAAFFVWRQRSRADYATAGGYDSFASAEPAPAPRPLQRAPVPAPPAAAPPAGSGIVSTRIRPWLDIEFAPGRCVVDEDKATIEFDITVVNSGSAPARDVLIEGSLFNAGPSQDQEIGAFFEHPVAQGERIPVIPPLKRVALKSAVSLNRNQLRQFEVAGRRLFVPLIGFNALYRWSGGDAQTSTSYLVGRESKGEKMKPFHLDLGPRIFRGLGAREHAIQVRR